MENKIYLIMGISMTYLPFRHFIYQVGYYVGAKSVNPKFSFSSMIDINDVLLLGVFVLGIISIIKYIKIVKRNNR